MPLAHVVSFDGVTSDRIEELKKEIGEGERPEEVLATEFGSERLSSDVRFCLLNLVLVSARRFIAKEGDVRRVTEDPVASRAAQARSHRRSAS